VQANFNEAIAFVRSRRGKGKSGQLVICVDEMVHLDEVNEEFNEGKNMTLAQRIMSKCMAWQDKEKGKLIFIFTAIVDTMYTQLQSRSGRRVEPLPLAMIPLADVFGSIIDVQPGVHQLILSCAGHPRATVDEINGVQEGLLSEGTNFPSALSAARSSIVKVCKFRLEHLNDDIVGEWFGIAGPSMRLREDLLNKGILHSVQGVEFLFPLLLHDWASDQNKKQDYLSMATTCPNFLTPILYWTMTQRN